MEEIGDRTAVCAFGGLCDLQRDDIAGHTPASRLWEAGRSQSSFRNIVLPAQGVQPGQVFIASKKSL